jgi:hypothetical protein
VTLRNCDVQKIFFKLVPVPVIQLPRYLLVRQTKKTSFYDFFALKCEIIIFFINDIIKYVFAVGSVFSIEEHGLLYTSTGIV